MLLSSKWVKFGVAIVLFFGVSGCANESQSGVNLTSLTAPGEVTNISKIQEQQLLNTTIFLKGKVGTHVPLLGGQVYELQDETGTVWVLTQEKPPNPGDKVVIKGQVRFQSIPLNGKEQGSLYVEQKEQVQHTPAKTISS
jgi:hypothetical protein